MAVVAISSCQRWDEDTFFSNFLLTTLDYRLPSSWVASQVECNLSIKKFIYSMACKMFPYCKWSNKHDWFRLCVSDFHEKEGKYVKYVCGETKSYKWEKYRFFTKCFLAWLVQTCLIFSLLWQFSSNSVENSRSAMLRLSAQLGGMESAENTFPH